VGKNNNGGYGAGRLEHEEQQAWYDADGFRRLLVVQGWSAVEAAQRTGVSDTTLLRIMDGRQEMIGDDVADRIAVALDHPLATIAPEGPVRYTARHNGGGRRK
jgi:transcriptional regulator with XRE-family HTH domain